MTRRERLEAKIERREEWAEKREAKAAPAFAEAEKYRGDTAFNTQPGHIPERARMITRQDRACEDMDMAEHHRAAAAGLQHQLDRSVFSDDANAIEQLEARIAKHEADAQKMVATNKAWRAHLKGDDAPLRALGFNTEDIAHLAANVAQTWDKKPVAAYEMTNLRARIRTDRLRIDEIKARQVRTAKAEASGGVLIEDHGEYMAVVFAEKPDREVLDALRAAGFMWGAGRWSGKTAALPECVKDLARRPDEDIAKIIAEANDEADRLEGHPGDPSEYGDK